MQKAFPTAALALLGATALLLPGCNSQPENTVTTGPVDPTAAKVAAAPKVELPPALSASHTYRCKDNSLFYVDFFDNGITANLRIEKGGDPTVLTAPSDGAPFAGGGYTLTGSGDIVTLAGPGKPSQSCKA